MAQYAKPYDPTGSAFSNRISLEPRTVQALGGGEQFMPMIIPEFTPFFRDGLEVYKVTAGGGGTVLLEEGVDYILTHQFMAASRSLDKGVYGSISILNREFSGQTLVTYQCLGGPYLLNENSIIASLTRRLYDQRTITFDQISGVPVAFPSYDHNHHLNQLKGYDDFITKLEELTLAVQNLNN